MNDKPEVGDGVPWSFLRERALRELAETVNSRRVGFKRSR